MSERRFVICEWDGLPAYNSITESELKRRVEWVIQWLNEDVNFSFTQYAWDKVQSVLIEGLNGEGKEVRCYSPDSCDSCADAGACEKFNSQPDPWEAWMEECPFGRLEFGGTTATDWATTVKNWFRKMPRGK